MSKKFVILTAHDRNKPSEFTVIKCVVISGKYSEIILGPSVGTVFALRLSHHAYQVNVEHEVCSSEQIFNYFAGIMRRRDRASVLLP
jgi:hypothetical protein